MWRVLNNSRHLMAKRAFGQTRKFSSFASMDRADLLEWAWNSTRLWQALGLGAVAGGIQTVYGSSKDFYQYRFVTKADPDDLQDFYGAEDFMQIYCVFPFMQKIMMRGSSWDEDGTLLISKKCSIG